MTFSEDNVGDGLKTISTSWIVWTVKSDLFTLGDIGFVDTFDFCYDPRTIYITVDKTAQHTTMATSNGGRKCYRKYLSCYYVWLRWTENVFKTATGCSRALAAITAKN